MEPILKDKSTEGLISDFLDNYCDKEFSEIKESDSIIIDFKKILKYDPSLAEQLIDDFENIQSLFSIIAKNMRINKWGVMDTKEVCVRFTNLNITETEIGEISANDIDNVIKIEGNIIRIGNVDARVLVIRYVCTNCADIITLPTIEGIIRKPKPHKCPGEGGRWKVISKEFEDVQRIVLEEEVITRQKPVSIVCKLTADLCKGKARKSIQVSKKMTVTGTIKDKMIKNSGDECKKYLLANNVSMIEDEQTNKTFTKEEIKEFHTLSKSDTLYEDLAQSVLPNIEGHDKVKEGIVLFLMGGTQTKEGDNITKRGKVHLLLVGSPGIGKSAILKRTSLFCPGCITTSGTGVSAVGLVAAAVKDEELGGWSVDAGAIPRSSGSSCLIDEIDKIKKEDISHMNTCMSEMKVRIDKANAHIVLECNTSILAAANPKNRVFDKQEPVWKQIGLPKDFMDRFDLIFPIIPNMKEEDRRKVAKLIVSNYGKNPNKYGPRISEQVVNNYLSYAKRINPKLTEETEDYIVDTFIKIMKPVDREEDAKYFSNRLVTNLARLTQAVARTRLSKIAVIQDAKRAIDLLIYSLKEQDIITNTGLYNFELGEGIVPKKKRNNIKILKDIIRGLCKDSTENLSNWIDICRLMSEQAKLDTDEVDDLIEKLKKEGELLETRKNQYQLL